MIVKDFLLSLDLEKLAQVYCKDSLSRDIEFVAQLKDHSIDINKKSYDLINNFISQIKTINPEHTPNEFLMVMLYYDFDYTDDLEMFKTKTYDAFILNKDDCTNPVKREFVKSLKEVHDNEYVWIPYSLMFVSWEKILGLEIGYLPDDIYAAAVAIIDELTFFGFDKNENDARVKEETAELDRINSEIEAGEVEYVPFDAEEFRRKFDLPEKTPEEKAKEDDLSKQIMIDNINESYRIYNMLLEQGFFDV